MIMSWRSRGRTHVITQSPQNLKFDGICVARSTCMWAAGISLSLSFSRIMHHFRLPPIQPQLEFHPRYRPSLRWSTEIAPSGFRRRKPSKHCRLLPWHPPDKTTFAREFFDWPTALAGSGKGCGEGANDQQRFTLTNYSAVMCCGSVIAILGSLSTSFRSRLHDLLSEFTSTKCPPRGRCNCCTDAWYVHKPSSV